jgi:hypothetical protein
MGYDFMLCFYCGLVIYCKALFWNNMKLWDFLSWTALIRYGMAKKGKAFFFATIYDLAEWRNGFLLFLFDTN